VINQGDRLHGMAQNPEPGCFGRSSITLPGSLRTSFSVVPPSLNCPVSYGPRPSPVAVAYTWPMNPKKLRLARACHVIRIDAMLFDFHRRLFRPYIRCLNYHDVPADQADNFEQQLRFYAQEFEPVDRDGFAALHTDRWRASKPGLMLSFDDGLRSHADIAAPLLEAYGFTGWFMVPPAFVDAEPEEQRTFALDHSIQYADPRSHDPRIAMTWDDVRRLDRRHVIGCHSWDHTRLTDSLSPRALELQTHHAKQRLENILRHEVAAFAWVGGEEWSYSRRAAEAIEQAGFTFAFMSSSHVIRPRADLQHLQRTNVEASDPHELMRFQISGLMDLYHAPRRRRVNRLTNA
jgi:peptidoglycan/xylan/chitin deacetylase (PgdA/CDA1 family)